MKFNFATYLLHPDTDSKHTPEKWKCAEKSYVRSLLKRENIYKQLTKNAISDFHFKPSNIVFFLHFQTRFVFVLLLFSLSQEPKKESFEEFVRSNRDLVGGEYVSGALVDEINLLKLREVRRRAGFFPEKSV